MCQGICPSCTPASRGAGSGQRMEGWPVDSGPGQQHRTGAILQELDIEVNGLSAAVEQAAALKATVADFQPQADVRVLYDPAGHPFCLFARTGPSA